MTVIAGESSGKIPTGNPRDDNMPKSLGSNLENIPWTDYAVQQAQIAHASWSDYRHLDSLQELKSEYSMYEDIVFGKIKEGFLIASSRPLITTGAVLGVGFLGLKSTRQFLSYKAMRLFLSEEALLSRADTKFKELQKSIEILKSEIEKLEKSALRAEEDFVRGRAKLRQAGTQMQGVINSAYKIERQARGLKEIIRELPSKEASTFRTQVKNIAKEAKKERSALSKEVTKINNYGISV